jgi:hypothetical protein
LIVFTSRVRFHVLPLLTCGLVLLASADDFNLGRFVFPFTESLSDGLLPLDDPNCDFTDPSDAPAPGTPDCGGANAAVILPRRAGMNRAPETAAFPFHPPARGCLDVPLRC